MLLLWCDTVHFLVSIHSRYMAPIPCSADFNAKILHTFIKVL